MTWWEKALAWITGRRVIASTGPATEAECFDLCWRLVDPEAFGGDQVSSVSVLTAELGMMIYNGKTADQAYDLLFKPRVVTRERVGDRQVRPISVIRVFGLERGRTILSAVRTALGADYDAIMGGGVNLDHPESQSFLDALVAGGVMTTAEREKLNQVGIEIEQVTYPPRACVAFNGIGGIPAVVPRDEFDMAWKAAGR